MYFKILGKDVAIKSLGCNVNNTPPQPIPPCVNLYIKVTDSCNANCLFCSNSWERTKKVSFDFSRFWIFIDELINRGIIINRFNITGGEPTLRRDLVFDILEGMENPKYSRIHIHLNSNGLRPISKNIMRHPRINSISLSLHHFDLKKISEIYGAELAKDYLEFDDFILKKLNLSCNLIKGFIDSAQKIEQMLKFGIDLNIRRIGFVALMKLNKYCIENYIDFDEINFESIPNLTFIKSQNRGTDCKCANYIYTVASQKLEVYIRNYSNPYYCESSLLYDGKHWKQGFQNENIIY